jgi:alpha-amylase
VCEHRDAVIANMVAFRRAVAGTSQLNWWDDGANAVAFSRGNKGFVVINHEAIALSRNFVTGLAAGKYCDVLAGGVAAGVCAGQTVTVDPFGNASIALGANTALVLQTGVGIP